jgi:hypothetical protein
MLRLTLALTVVLALAACSTRLNPLNWFGGDREERIAVVETEVEVDPRMLVSEVVSMSVDAVPQGAIIRATGLPPTQGHWAADLVEVERTESALVFEFRLLPPPTQTRQGPPQSREIITGTQLSNFELAGIRTITVIGAQNRRSVTRR